MMNLRILDLPFLREKIYSGDYRLTFENINVPVRYRRGRNDLMIVIFHGAINRKTRTIPRFQPTFPDLSGCHQLSIADPTLELDHEIESGWYLGGESIPLQEHLPALIKSFSELIGVERRLYLGSSSGGFAALYYSWADSGSVCVALNPQTDLTAYKLKKSNPTRTLVEKAWPISGSLENVGKSNTISLPSAYQRKFENFLIYIQSVGDLNHYALQMPSLCKVCLQAPERFILNTGYWGVPNHSRSVPLDVYLLWVKAVVSAPWCDRQAILDTHHILSLKNVPDEAKPCQKAKSGTSQKNLLLSSLVRDYHLRQPLENGNGNHQQPL